VRHVHDHLDQHGPLRVDNVWQAAQAIGIDTSALVRVLALVRSPEWIEVYGWTIPFVRKGPAVKSYSVAYVTGQTSLLRNGNQIKADETETHLRRSLAGLKLEAKLATGADQRKAQILATTAEAALTLIDLGP
jgi:hypothetical protein